MTADELKEILRYESGLYLGDRKAELKRSRHKRYAIWEYLRFFRLCQYWRSVREDQNAGFFERRKAKHLSRRYERKKNVAGEKAGVEIGLQCSIGKGLDIWHSGVVINGSVGENCVFRGCNTVGGKADIISVPVIGSNVNVGAGAVIIGDLRIADGCVIGANAVVTKSFDLPGSVIAGVPAKVIGG